jgi:DNA-binding GntR family transcriptional regulator
MARQLALQTAPRPAADPARDPVAAALAGGALDPRQSYSDQVEARLRDAIVSGALAPGTALSEATVALAAGVSRQPVREALRQLAQENLVDVYPQVGTVVAPVRVTLIHEGRFIRRALEIANLQELVRTIAPPQVVELRRVLALQRAAVEAGRADEFFRLDETMHSLFFRFTGRERVWTLVAGVKVHLDRVRFLLLDRVAKHAARALREHQSLVARLAAHDGPGVAKLIRQHVDSVAEDLELLRANTPEGFFRD